MHLEPKLNGLHHVTAASARIKENLRFYTHTLGMRLVKRSVNQDDVSAYHLFYADEEGTPGTDLTFFDWAHLPRERRGNNSISRVSLRVATEGSLRWWREYLKDQGVSVGAIGKTAGRPTMDFEDFEGQRLRLTVADEPRNRPWRLEHIPLEHAILGLGPVRLTVPHLEGTDWALTHVMGARRVDAEGITIYQVGAETAQAEVHVEVEPDLPPAAFGAGAVHHVAFRTPDDASIRAWSERLTRLRVPHSGIVDRFWFKSIYFREPNGILFEIATDTPGFAVDEDPAHLGERLILPPFLEPQRPFIEAGLKPLEG